jgi:hypothetical protein
MSTERTMTTRIVSSALLVLMLASGPGCKEKRQGHCPKYEQIRAVEPQPGDLVVAEVDGRPVLASAVRRRARRKGLTAPEALAELIDEELLVQEAERRGLHRDPVVVEAGKAAAIYRLLAETFAKEYTPSKVPNAELRRIYKRESLRWFNRPELRRFGHAYLTRPWSKRNRRWHIDIEKDRDLRRVMENFGRLVAEKRPKTWETFKALADGFDQGKQSLAVGKALQAHKDLRRPFADALFALKGPGAFSEVIETKRWYHVAFLIEVLPRKNISFAQAREEIRAKLFPHVRKKAFKAWLDKVKRQCSIRVKPENLPVGERSTGRTAAEGK